MCVICNFKCMYRVSLFPQQSKFPFYITRQMLKCSSLDISYFVAKFVITSYIYFNTIYKQEHAFLIKYFSCIIIQMYTTIYRNERSGYFSIIFMCNLVSMHDFQFCSNPCHKTYDTHFKQLLAIQDHNVKLTVAKSFLCARKFYKQAFNCSAQCYVHFYCLQLKLVAKLSLLMGVGVQFRWSCHVISAKLN